MEGLFTRKQAAEYMGVSISTMDRIIRAGQIAYVQRVPSGNIWISLDAINEYIARATKPATPALAVRATYRKRRAAR